MWSSETPAGLQSGGHRLFVALDTPHRDRAVALAQALSGAGLGERLGLKLGLEYFTACGPDGVAAVASVGLPIFLDLKFHDIPNTVAGAVRSAVDTVAPVCFTVHASGGPDMLRAAVAAAVDVQAPVRPAVLAVTVLTSLDDGGLAAVGQQLPAVSQVERLARLAMQAGCDGVVCSPLEAAMVRRCCGPSAAIVVPGIRPAGSASGDQRRVTTPGDALAAGANHLVVGRPITGADDPVAAARSIVAEIDAAALRAVAV